MSQIVPNVLKARITALNADVVAARQDAGAYFTTVQELKRLLKVMREDAQKDTPVIAERQDQLKVFEEDREVLKADPELTHNSKSATCP